MMARWSLLRLLGRLVPLLVAAFSLDVALKAAIVALFVSLLETIDFAQQILDAPFFSVALETR